MKQVSICLRAFALLLLGLVWMAGTIPAHAATLTILHALNSATEGNQPAGGLVQGPDGSLYGVTRNGVSVAFQIAPDGTFHILHKFASYSDGDLPFAKLLLVGNQLFGTCAAGGGNDISQSNGTVFVIDLTKVSASDNTAGFALLHTFGADTAIVDGSGPKGVLTLDSDGDIYGTTYAGGMAGFGTVFQLKPNSSGQFSNNSTYTKLYDFLGGTSDGTHPYGGVIQGPGGFLYGTTNQGGLKNYGTVYKIARDGTGVTLLHSFTGGNSFNGTPVGDGAGSEGELLFAVDGNLYGTAIYGAAKNCGAVFQIKPGTDGVFGGNAAFQTLHNFASATDGSGLLGGLIQASDGSLVGTTYSGGSSGSGSGTVFMIASTSGQFDSTSSFSLLYSFTSGPGAPRGIDAPVIQGLDGQLYGESIQGGQLVGPGTAGGTVFALDAGLEAPPVVSGVTGGSGNAVKTSDTSLVISGTHFASNFTNLPVVRVDGVPVTITAQDYHQALEKITVTLPVALTAGSHNVTVGTSGSFAFQVVQPAPKISQITNGVGGSVTPVDTTLIIHGLSFAAGDGVNIDGQPTDRVSVIGSSQLTVILSQPLPAGSHPVTVFHQAPDGQLSNVYNLLVVSSTPTINAITGSGASGTIDTNDLTLVVHGTGFITTDSVNIFGTDASVIVAGRNLTDPTDEKISVTLSHALAKGTYTAKVSRSTAPFSFNVGAAPQPTITAVQVVQTTILAITGTNFVSGATVVVTNGTDGTTHTATVKFNSSSSLEADFTSDQAITPGLSLVTVTNPKTVTNLNGDKAYYLFEVPSITTIDYTAGTTTVTIHGIGFASDAKVSIGDPSNGNIILPLDITDGSQIVVTLLNPLPPGIHTFTVTNPDGQSASASIKTITPVAYMQPTIDTSTPVGGFTITPGGAGFNGSVHFTQLNPDPNSLPSAAAPAATRVSAKSSRVGTRVATTTNYPVIYDMTADTAFNDITGHGYLPTYIIIKGSGFDAADTDALTTVTVDGVVYSKSGVVVDDANTIELFLNKTILDTKEHSLFVTNPNGHSSQTKSFGIVNGRFVNGKFFRTPFTSYNVNVQNAPLSGPGTTVGATGQSPLGGPYQKVAFGVSNNLISQDGGGLIGPDGANIVASGGGNIVAQGGGNIVAQGGGNIVAQGGGNIVAQGGGNLILANGGKIVAAGGGNLITNDGASVISTNGSNLVSGGSVFTGASLTSTSSRMFSRRSAALSAAPTTGYMDVTLFVSKAGQGIRLLVTRYTPGERDLILYKDPSVTVTPNPGTPAPLAAIAGVTVTRGPVTSDHHTHQPYQVLTLTNTGAATLSGPVLVALTGLPAGVTVSGSAGIVASSPAVTASGSGLAPGASVKVRVDFSDPTNVRFSYGTAVYAGL